MFEEKNLFAIIAWALHVFLFYTKRLIAINFALKKVSKALLSHLATIC